MVPAEVFDLDVAPTSVSMVGTYRSFGQAAWKLTQSFHWHHISILVDISVVSTDFHRILAYEIMVAATMSNTSSTAKFNFNGSDHTSILTSSQNAQRRSRGTDSRIVIRVLVEYIPPAHYYFRLCLCAVNLL